MHRPNRASRIFASDAGFFGKVGFRSNPRGVGPQRRKLLTLPRVERFRCVPPRLSLRALDARAYLFEQLEYRPAGQPNAEFASKKLIGNHERSQRKAKQGFAQLV